MRLQDMEFFAQYKAETLEDLEASMKIRSFEAGETIYARGAAGDELYWVRSGTVRLMAHLEAGMSKPVASFGRGDTFGSLSFLDNQPRPNDAIALTRAEVYVLTREQFNQIAEGHKKLAFNMANAMARTLAMRLRRTERKLTMLQEY
jgi:SulP family sulfate permease